MPPQFGGPCPPLQAPHPTVPGEKGKIVHPEFVNFLVHPDVDPYKDLPKLPGQSDGPSPYNDYNYNIYLGWSSGSIQPPETQDVLQSMPEYTLTDKDLQEILELD